MRNLNSNTYFYEKPFNHTYIANPQFSKNFSELKTGYTTFQNTNLDNKILGDFDEDKISNSAPPLLNFKSETLKINSLLKNNEFNNQLVNNDEFVSSIFCNLAKSL